MSGDFDDILRAEAKSFVVPWQLICFGMADPRRAEDAFERALERRARAMPMPMGHRFVELVSEELRAARMRLRRVGMCREIGNV